MASDSPLRLASEEEAPGHGLEPLLTDLRGLVRLTTLGLRTLRRLDAAGDIPGRVVVGRRVLFRLEILHQWIEAGMPDKARWDALQKFANRRSR